MVQKSQDKADKLFADLERLTLPLEGRAEISELADRINKSAQRLARLLADEADRLARGEIRDHGFELTAKRIGTGISQLNLVLDLIIKSAAVKHRANSGK